MLTTVTRDSETARDVVQEAFAKALQKHQGEGSLEGWVWRIAFRVALDSRGSRELAVDELPDVSFLDPSRDPELHAAVQALPRQRRMVVFLRSFADLPYDEISEILGIAEGTVAATLSQAHSQLSETLRPVEATP